MKNKILVELIVPEIEEHYNIYIPIHKKIGSVINLLNKSIFELSNGNYSGGNKNFLYNRDTNERYDLNDKVFNTNIRNGSILVLL